MITVAEVAAMLQVPRSWIYNHISNGTLPFPHVKIGEHFVRFRESDIDKYLDNKFKAAQETAEQRRRLREVM